MNEDEAREVLYRVDERTRNIERKLDTLTEKTQENDEKIAKLRQDTNTNTQNISTAKAFLGLLGAAVSGIALKLFEVITL